MVRYRDAYSVTWAVGNKAIEIDALPGGAFDSDAERARVRSLLASYNGDLRMTPSLDRQFGALARERSAAHPLRTFVWVPVARAFVMWFTPRVDVLRYSGKLWPPGEQWSAKPVEFCVTLIFGLLNFVYVGLALVGAWRYRRNPGVALVVSYLLFRTGLLTQLPTVEPRYVVICFPVVIALDEARCVACRTQQFGHGERRLIARGAKRRNDNPRRERLTGAAASPGFSRCTSAGAR
jgi:hypothetical protein